MGVKKTLRNIADKLGSEEGRGNYQEYSPLELSTAAWEIRGYLGEVPGEGKFWVGRELSEDVMP